MNIKFLMQALKFACLPTLSVIVLLFFGFFDISDTVDFLSSQTGPAVALRVFLVIAELVVIVIMYQRYKEEANLTEELPLMGKEPKYYFESRRTELCDIFYRVDSGETFHVYETSNPKIKVIKRND